MMTYPTWLAFDLAPGPLRTHVLVAAVDLGLAIRTEGGARFAVCVTSPLVAYEFGARSEARGAAGASLAVADALEGGLMHEPPRVLARVLRHLFDRVPDDVLVSVNPEGQLVLERDSRFFGFIDLAAGRLELREQPPVHHGPGEP